MEQLVLNFRPLAGGFKCDVKIQFLHTYFWAPQQWENTWGAKKFKSRLFLNRSNRSSQVTSFGLACYLKMAIAMVLTKIEAFSSRQKQGN